MQQCQVLCITKNICQEPVTRFPPSEGMLAILSDTMQSLERLLWLFLRIPAEQPIPADEHEIAEH
jgi:hypothetical protein